MNELQVTQCQHVETRQIANIPTDALDGWQKLGWEPIGESRSLEELQTAAIYADNDQVPALPVAEMVEDHTVKQILAEVGDDVEKARAALEAEQASDQPRTTLIARLTQITEAGQPGDPEGK